MRVLSLCEAQIVVGDFFYRDFWMLSIGNHLIQLRSTHHMHIHNNSKNKIKMERKFMNICGVDSYLTKITFVKKQKKKSSSFHEKGETLWVYVVCSMYWPAQRKFPQHLFIGETETETETEQDPQMIRHHSPIHSIFPILFSLPQATPQKNP